MFESVSTARLLVMLGAFLVLSMLGVGAYNALKNAVRKHMPVVSTGPELMFKRVVMASDHRGQALQVTLAGLSYQDVVLEKAEEGASQASVDYPDKVPPVVRAVSSGSDVCGVLICGSGQGMAMAANRFRGIRAALCHDEQTARLARQHNNANVLVLGSGSTTPEHASAILRVFLSTPFEGGRHQPRIDKLDQLSD